MICHVRRSAIVVGTIAVLALTLVAPCVVHADAAQAPSADAKRSASVHFRRGVDLYQEGNYRAALIELNRANEIAPDFHVLFNVGQTHYALGEYVEAIRAFEGYLEHGGSEIASTRRDEVTNTLTELNKRVATVHVTTNRPNAEVTIDGVVVGKTPLSAPLAVNLGRHHIAAETADGATASESIEVAGGDARTVALVLVAPVVAQGPAAVAPPAPPSWWQKQSMRKKVGYGLVAAGVASAIGGAIMGGLAASAKSDYDKALKARPGDRGNIDSAHDDLKRNALVADVFFGTAIAAGVTGLVLALVKDKHAEDVQAKRPAFQVGVGYQSFVATRRF